MYDNGYAQTLRLIGQDLEKLLIEKLDLESRQIRFHCKRRDCGF